ncbi:MAG: hypothetical protein JNN05_10510 [Candidatus Omnitrophica bacterium]|nr:hypothetical protein [Candidatus Omnitrophota bacterium]
MALPDEHDKYAQWQVLQEKRWESLCGRCGACCGVVENDPCEHLRGHQKGGYYCSIYDRRFGEHKTVNGRTVQCVPVRQIIHSSWLGDECCGYKRDLKNIIAGDNG